MQTLLPNSKAIEGLRRDLPPCRCCKAVARLVQSSVTGHVTIACSRAGCILVDASTEADAIKLWKERDFRDG